MATSSRSAGGQSRSKSSTTAKKSTSRATKKSSSSGAGATKKTSSSSAGATKKSSSSRAGERRNGTKPSSTPSSAADVAAAAASQLRDLSGKEPEGISGLERTEDGWKVEVEVVELRRIPATTDVIASYEVTVDAEGVLQGYRRLRRYSRGDARDE
jgi:hypothetical protein